MGKKASLPARPGRPSKRYLKSLSLTRGALGRFSSLKEADVKARFSTDVIPIATALRWLGDIWKLKKVERDRPRLLPQDVIAALGITRRELYTVSKTVGDIEYDVCARRRFTLNQFAIMARHFRATKWIKLLDESP